MSADIAWQDFESLVRDPTAVAFEVVTATTSGAGLPPLESLPDETVSALLLLFTATRLQAGATATDDPTLAAEAAVRAEVDERGLPAVAVGGPTAAEVDIAATINDANQALIRQWQDPDSSSKVARVPELLAAEDSLAACPDDLPASRLREINDIRVDLATAVAETYAGAADGESALAAWHQALARARAADRLGAGDSVTLAIVRRFCEWIGRSDPGAALREFLPVVEQVLDGPADIRRVQMLEFLCSFYVDHGDDVTARDMVGRLEKELRLLGFADSPAGDYLDVLATWVRAATQCSRSAAVQREALHSAVTGWLRVITSQVRLGTDPYAQADRIDRLTEFGREMTRREAAVASVDQQAVARRLGPVDGAAGPPVVHDAAAAGELLTRFGVLVERCNGGDVSDDLVAALRDVASDPAGTPSSRARAALMAGQTLSGRQEWDTAHADFESAIALARSAVDLGVETDAWAQLIIEQFERGDYAAASQLSSRAIESVEAVRNRIGAPYLESGFMQDRSQPYIWGIEAARRCGDWQLVLERTELLKARALQSPAPPKDAHTPLLDELRRLSRDAARAPNRDELRARRRIVWERLLVEREQCFPRFDLAALQTLIAGRAVVLAYFFLAEDTLLRVCISGSSVMCDKVPLGGQPEFFASLDRLVQATSGSPSVESDLDAVAPVLLPESFRAEVEAAAQVIVCPHQSLHQVPFAALPFAGTTLIAHKPVGMTPNLTCLLHATIETDSRTAYFGIATRASCDMDGRPMNSLDGAEREVRSIAKLFGTPSCVLLGPQVTREDVDSAEVRRQLESARVVHLALHGSDVADKDIADAPMEVRLYLSDGPVDGLDIITWSLDADLVLLSACHAAKRATSARGLARLPADTAFGLQAAFHQAGARAVIGPLWAVADQVAPEVIRPLCAALRDGRDPATALQHAVRCYLDGAAGSWRSPALWACFTLVGFSAEAFGLSLSAM